MTNLSDGSYRELFDGNPQPMLVLCGENGRVLAANRAALSLYGYGREELMDRTLRQLTAADGTIPPGTGDRVSSDRHRKKDGTLFGVDLRWHSTTFEGQTAELVTISEAREARVADLERQVADRAAELNSSQRELETFCYSLSHDLKAPIRHIDGFSKAILDDFSPQLDPQAREYLVRIGQSAAKMSQLLEAVGQLARVSRTDLDRQPVNLSVQAQIYLLGLKHRFPGRDVEIDVAEGVSVQADPRLARQLVEILLDNAWKFSSKTESARIEFGAAEKEGELVCFVRDNGAGFDMAYAEKLFSVFHRLHRADEFEGSGVGLAVAQRIVRRHGGRIWAESAPGKGAIFYFTLPAPQ
ncbi:ATP-binding protein [Geomonas sp. Red32]|uniref:ATP-binding protein n=1 Tax=Geomonas sp. Red32 TaxID=2912856 RepID=UPI00202CE746|nr:ATP-binding protein [Geomonas sp. Red32]MCM0080825.1 ATP-binding protein [Geomonas sp. Red32]